MKNNRIKLILTIFSIAILFYHGLNLYYFWSDIPNEIAIHFSNDKPDQWGSKYFLVIMPILSILFWFLIGIIARKPETLNYINLTEKNKEIQYLKAERVLLFIQNIGSVTFIFTNEAFLRSAAGMETTVPLFIAIALLVVCLIAPLYLLIWAATLKY